MIHCWKEDPELRPGFESLQKNLQKMEEQHEVRNNISTRFKELCNAGKLAVFIMQPLDIKAYDFSTLLAFVERLKNHAAWNSFIRNI